MAHQFPVESSYDQTTAQYNQELQPARTDESNCDDGHLNSRSIGDNSDNGSLRNRDAPHPSSARCSSTLFERLFNSHTTPLQYTIAHWRRKGFTDRMFTALENAFKRSPYIDERKILLLIRAEPSLQTVLGDNRSNKFHCLRYWFKVQSSEAIIFLLSNLHSLFSLYLGAA